MLICPGLAALFLAFSYVGCQGRVASVLPSRPGKLHWEACDRFVAGDRLWALSETKSAINSLAAEFLIQSDQNSFDHFGCLGSQDELWSCRSFD